jgi:hypothetical protein
VLVNYGQGGNRFTDIQLGDCGNTVPDDSPWARDCDMIGAPIWRSPEAMLQIGWGTPTDIWSFGALVSNISASSTRISVDTNNPLPAAYSIDVWRQPVYLQTGRAS